MFCKRRLITSGPRISEPFYNSTSATTSDQHYPYAATRSARLRYFRSVQQASGQQCHRRRLAQLQSATPRGLHPGSQTRITTMT
ncbi:unnamed protein product [Trichogramma brassicae]|uniref:Uncharacterized protein n=1 Tax=Trichogramma brassicae TaxID=86971 RepID=A0A6H5J0W4_9HYME|nr:unnamed protein product [Trichogramma brassicae]